ncbi:MAG: C69 family dipeptidase [Bacteroidales bacterium]|nr:C69 family dipeptidase [Bacteroidales bacterium]
MKNILNFFSKSYAFIALSIFAIPSNSEACTNFLITKSASGGNGNIITYSADSHQLYGYLYHQNAQDWPDGAMLDVYDWDSGKFMGKIPQVSHTFNVVGNQNENQVVIAESTYGGLEQLLAQDGAIMDYGSLIYIALQRSKTAREAIKIITDLADLYGYASEGESFSIADKNEVWIMEVIGKGNFDKGMVWVARRVPDGYISGHANQARITTFNFQKKNRWNDPKADTFNSEDVVTFAIDNNFYNGSVKEFSFSDVYNPVNFEGARMCDLRVWTFFKSAAPKSFDKNNKFWDYSIGNINRIKEYNGGCQTPDMFPTNRLPLWIKPDWHVTIHQAMNAMRNHLENTVLDMAGDIGAGPFECPYRMRPLTFEVDGKTYFNERCVATQQTGWVFASQSRDWLPDFVGGIFWFGTDDAASTVLTPFYCCLTSVTEEYAQNNGSLIEWSDNSSFWVNNMISNWAYTRYNLIHPEIEKVQQKQEMDFIEKTKDIDEKAVNIAKNNENDAIKFLTDFSNNNAANLVKERKKLFNYLFMKYMDGNVKINDGDQKLKDNGSGLGIPELTQPGYGKTWEENVARSTGDKLLEK